MTEYYIERTHQISEGYGEVYLYFKDDDDNEVGLIYNASELLRDLPSLYEFAKRADAKEREWIAKQYRDLGKKIDKDYKRPVGRPPKE